MYNRVGQKILFAPCIFSQIVLAILTPCSQIELKSVAHRPLTKALKTSHSPTFSTAALKLPLLVRGLWATDLNSI